MTSDPALVYHRGFDLRLLPDTQGFAFEVAHLDLTLHASTPSYRTPISAVRAARQFVDDALSVFGGTPRTLTA